MVTGGAGYIGAHTSHLLASRGDFVLIADDLSSGSRARVAGFPLLEVDLAEPASVAVIADAIRTHRIDSVIHFAARKQVAESVQRPAWYYQQNVGSIANLILALEVEKTCSRLVFSSTAAVYGQAGGVIDENRQPDPMNPYGASKLAGEQLIDATSAAWPLSAASLRYFNVGGSARAELADKGASNLIPIILDQLTSGQRPGIFGSDYDTPDGSCIRDYVHITDVAEAHLVVLDSLVRRTGHAVMNVGTGSGTSVLEMVAALMNESGIRAEPRMLPRRPGDAAEVVAAVDRIATATGWRARFTLDDIVASAWDARRHEVVRAESG
jgi:UDP-glucose 4-epimerase